MKKWVFLSILITLLTPISASAKTMNDLSDTLKMLDYSLKRVEKLITTVKKVTMGGKFNAMQRFLNGVYLLKNKRPQDAAALFMSLIHHPKLGKEASFYYSEAMYHSKNYLVAAEYYKKVLVQKWNPAFRSKAIKRILEISMKSQTRDKGRIEELIKIILKVIEEAPEIKNSPEVKYALGKYAYYKASRELKKPIGIRNNKFALDKYLEALKLFNSIVPKKNSKGKIIFPKLYPQAVYYSGATLVKLALSGGVSYYKGNKFINLETKLSSPFEMKQVLLYEAINRFTNLAIDEKLGKLLKKIKKKTNNDAILIFLPRNKDEKEIQTLARLAMGRIFYELEETGESVKWYKTVSQKSKYYESALYEMAWVYVRENEIMKAVQTLAIMEVRNKNSVFLPKARLLLGYLKVKGKKWVGASRSFTKTSFTYKKVFKKLDLLKKQNIDPERFFDQVMRSMEKKGKTGKKSILKSDYKIPKESLPIFKKDRNFMKAILIIDDIHVIKKSLYEANNALQVIKRRLQSATKVAIFPILNSSRKKVYSYEFSNMGVREELVKIAIAKFSHLLKGNALKELNKLNKSRKSIEQKMVSMPKSTDSLNKRLSKKRKVYDDKLMKVDNYKKDLITYRQYVSELFKFYQNLPAKKKAKLKGIVAKLRNEAQNIESSIEMAKVIRSKIVDASLEVGVDDNDMIAERQTRGEYRLIIKKVFSLFKIVRGQMSSSEAVLFDKILTMLESSKKLDKRMDNINSKIYALADSKLSNIKKKVSEESKNIKVYKKEYADYTHQTKVLSKDVSKESITSIAAGFEKIVIEADLGVVDVSWSRRSESRNKWAHLNHRKVKITKELQSRFGEVQDTKISFDKKRYADPFAKKINKSVVKTDTVKANKNNKKKRGTK